MLAVGALLAIVTALYLRRRPDAIGRACGVLPSMAIGLAIGGAAGWALRGQGRAVPVRDRAREPAVDPRRGADLPRYRAARARGALAAPSPRRRRGGRRDRVPGHARPVAAGARRRRRGLVAARRDRPHRARASSRARRSCCWSPSSRRSENQPSARPSARCARRRRRVFGRAAMPVAFGASASTSATGSLPSDRGGRDRRSQAIHRRGARELLQQHRQAADREPLVGVDRAGGVLASPTPTRARRSPAVPWSPSPTSPAASVAPKRPPAIAPVDHPLRGLRRA